MLRAKGLLQPMTENANSSEATLHEAFSVARVQGARLFELQVARGLARLLQGQDRQTEARALLPVYAWFAEGHGLPDLKEAKALLAAI